MEDNTIPQRPTWVPDSEVTHCTACKQIFEFLVRWKHHCRNCGQIFCGDCSRGRALLPEQFKYDGPKRVCDACLKELDSAGDSRFHQAGGHSSGVVRSHPGFVTKHTTSGELKFFQNLAKSPYISEEIRLAFFPRVETIVDQLLNKTVTMEDLTFGYSKPCVMDVKMGNCTVGDDANIFKEMYMVNKDKHTTTFDLGCRIVAYRTYDPIKKEFVQLPKVEANKVTNIQQFEVAFLNFFTSGGLRRDVIEECLKKLLTLHAWMTVQVHYKFVASSLLFVYDADMPLRANVTMIDFAHVFDITNGATDVGYIKGLDTLIALMKKTLDQQ